MGSGSIRYIESIITGTTTTKTTKAGEGTITGIFGPNIAIMTDAATMTAGTAKALGVIMVEAGTIAAKGGMTTGVAAGSG